MELGRALAAAGGSQNEATAGFGSLEIPLISFGVPHVVPGI